MTKRRFEPGRLRFDPRNVARQYHVGVRDRLLARRQQLGQFAVLRFAADENFTRNSRHDEGFKALSESETIEYIWGRECPNVGLLR
ncbi:MAG: hypothetical protein AUJ01_07380 [Acidobacteria bacterium 13_1_40CM_3_65_5]|nr:MAG: hypothetical protein AUJ01_07380 [Acidobacteria bacterium 13_1_40CM_3_65_5]